MIGGKFDVHYGSKDRSQDGDLVDHVVDIGEGVLERIDDLLDEGLQLVVWVVSGEALLRSEGLERVVDLVEVRQAGTGGFAPCEELR